MPSDADNGRHRHVNHQASPKPSRRRWRSYSVGQPPMPYRVTGAVILGPEANQAAADQVEVVARHADSWLDARSCLQQVQ